ncbi:MAG TPA: rhodanese-like domain-containing protein, partial [Acidimicrobiales bacterium]
MRRLVPALLLLFAVVVAACGGDDSGGAGGGAPGVRLVSAQKASAMTAGRTIIDVRTPAEFAAGHLQDAVNIDFRASDFRSRIEGLE